MPFWLTVVPYLTAFSPAHPTLEGNWGTGPPTPLRVAVPLPVGCCWLLPNKDPFGQVKTKGQRTRFIPMEKKAQLILFFFGELEKCDVSSTFTGCLWSMPLGRCAPSGASGGPSAAAQRCLLWGGQRRTLPERSR